MDFWYGYYRYQIYEMNTFHATFQHLTYLTFMMSVCLLGWGVINWWWIRACEWFYTQQEGDDHFSTRTHFLRTTDQATPKRRGIHAMWACACVRVRGKTSKSRTNTISSSFGSHLGSLIFYLQQSRQVYVLLMLEIAFLVLITWYLRLGKTC